MVAFLFTALEQKRGCLVLSGGASALRDSKQTAAPCAPNPATDHYPFEM